MNMSSLQFLTPQKYDKLRSAVEGTADLAEDSAILGGLQTIINEHAAMVRLLSEEWTNQERAARGVFNSFETCDPLFRDSQLGVSGASNQDEQPQKSSAASGTVPADNPHPEHPSAGSDRKRKPPRKPDKTIEHRLTADQLVCPCCGKTMHRAHKKKDVIIRLNGFSREEHLSETARCLTCETKVEAEGPCERTFGNFSAEAAAGVTALRYVHGLPSKRLEEISSSLGYYIPDSTQWDVFEATANELRDFFVFIRIQAASAPVIHMDDTSVTINEISAEIKAADQIGQQRTGVHTTGSLAVFPEGKICLFDSGLHHAGEFFADLMDARTIDSAVLVMTDAASANSCKYKDVNNDVTEANCNSHAVRRFKDAAKNPVFAEQAGPILKNYAAIFKMDQSLKEATPAERLEAHRSVSLPRMEAIRSQIQEDLRLCRVEPNSELGKNYRYFLNHYTKLTAFCQFESAPICNNAAERLLKRAIRHRKNSLFFKNRIGAAVGDIHMSILMTAVENQVEPMQYMADLLNFSDHRKANPHLWLPWHYPQTIKDLRGTPPDNQIPPPSTEALH